MAKVSDTQAVNVVAFSSASVSAYVAMILSAKLGIPMEGAAAIVAVAATLGGKVVKAIDRIGQRQPKRLTAAEWAAIKDDTAQVQRPDLEDLKLLENSAILKAPNFSPGSRVDSQL